MKIYLFIKFSFIAVVDWWPNFSSINSNVHKNMLAPINVYPFFLKGKEFWL